MTNLFSRVRNIGGRWLSHFENQPLIHKPSKVKIHILGVNGIGSSSQELRRILGALKPSSIAHDQTIVRVPWWPEYVALLAKTQDSTLDAKAQRLHQTMRDLFSHEMTTLFKEGLAPFDSICVAQQYTTSASIPLQFAIPKDLVAAERIAVDSARLKAKSQDELDNANVALAGSLRKLFAKHDVSSSDIHDLQALIGHAFSAQELLMTPDLAADYSEVLGDWVEKSLPSKNHYGMLLSIQNLKARTIAELCISSCIKATSVGSSDPIAIIVDLKLVHKIREHLHRNGIEES
ncbi:hypothetical protein HDU67_005561 [Dinochytrium kinnereticum]|nr:hypothetical protein HDU67_005561 [Dinochytrium kinnereticum]